LGPARPAADDPLGVSQGDQLTVVLLGELVDDVRMQVHDVILHVCHRGDERRD
jgi:hypothetical protein